MYICNKSRAIYKGDFLVVHLTLMKANIYAKVTGTEINNPTKSSELLKHL